MHPTLVRAHRSATKKKRDHSGHSDIYRSMETSHVLRLWDDVFRRTTTRFERDGSLRSLP